MAKLGTMANRVAHFSPKTPEPLENKYSRAISNTL
jgi:hypothetical protein